MNIIGKVVPNRSGLEIEIIVDNQIHHLMYDSRSGHDRKNMTHAVLTQDFPADGKSFFLKFGRRRESCDQEFFNTHYDIVKLCKNENEALETLEGLNK